MLSTKPTSMEGGNDLTQYILFYSYESFTHPVYALTSQQRSEGKDPNSAYDVLKKKERISLNSQQMVGEISRMWIEICIPII